MTGTRLALEPPTRPTASAVFDRVLVCIDGTMPGVEPCRQVAQLATSDSRFEAVFVQLARLLDERHERSVTKSLAVAKEILGPRSRIEWLHGLVVDQLLAEAERIDATLIAIGAHRHRRVEEILFGCVPAELLQRARCAVLVARPVPDLATFPHSVVAGLDGSEEAELAFEVAELLAGRRHGTLQRLAGCGDTHIDALVEASARSDLVVVGGSVAERVADLAHSSVLVVQTAKEE